MKHVKKQKKEEKEMKPKLYQVDFYPDGRIVKHYDNDGVGHHIHYKPTIKPKTPAEELQDRLKKFKERKRKNK